MFFFKALLVSLNLHVWGIGLLSDSLTRTPPPPTREILEFSLVEVMPLPTAPDWGQAGHNDEPRLHRSIQGNFSSSLETPPKEPGSEGDPQIPSRRSTEKVSSGHPKIVEIAKIIKRTGTSQSVRVGEQITAGVLRKPKEPRVDYKIRVLSWSKPNSDSSLLHAIGQIPSGDDRPIGNLTRLASFEKASIGQAEQALQKTTFWTIETPGDTKTSQGVAEEGSVGGDPRDLIKIIQAKIDAVTPLAYASSSGCRGNIGEVRVRFVINSNGYTQRHQVLASTGTSCLNREIEYVLHLAEPFPFVAGWIPVVVRFGI